MRARHRWQPWMLREFGVHPWMVKDYTLVELRALAEDARARAEEG